MKGIILAGGLGSRLRPLTKVINKHLLPVENLPMIYYPIYKLISAGITDILIVTGLEHIGSVISQLGSGKEFNCTFTYKVQDEAGGIAQALYLAKSFIGNDSMVVLLGDNIFEDSLQQAITSFKQNPIGAKIFLKEVEDPNRFGVAEISESKIIGIEEKPLTPKTNYAVTGIYIYDSQVFDFIEKLKPSDRGEYEITDVNNNYIALNQLSFEILKGWWSDAGTFSSIQRASELIKISPPKY